MRLQPFPAAALASILLGCGDPAPPPKPVGATSRVPAPAAAAPQPQRTTPLPIDSAAPKTFGPFRIEGATYTATATRFTSRAEGDSVSGTSRVDIRDSLQHVVYSARVLSDTEIARGSWNDFAVSPLEDASGKVRALTLWTSWYPSAPATGEQFAVVAPRGDSLRQLFVLDWFGNELTTATNTTNNGLRLLPGDRIEAPRWMFFYEAKVALHVSLDCVAGSRRCLQIALPDSIAGLARFPVSVSTKEATDSAATVELFDAPLAAHGTEVTVAKGVVVEVLGGAGKVSFEWDGEVQRVNVTDDWLFVRVNGRTGWITGDKSYKAIGLQEAG